MHHKRKGPKSTRSGCLLCKPHKRQGVLRTVKVKGQPGRQLLRRAATGEGLQPLGGPAPSGRRRL